MQTGQKIAKLRIEANLTQEELARRLFVTQQLVSQWEKGTRRPNYKMSEQIANVFSVKTEEIFETNENVLRELSDCIPENKCVDVAELGKYLNSFMPTLSEKERVIFLRRYYFIDESKEIAERLNMKDNQVRTVLSRVRNKLKKYLEEC